MRNRAGICIHDLIKIFHRPNEDFDHRRFFMKMRKEDEKPFFFHPRRFEDFNFNFEIIFEEMDDVKIIF